MAHLFGPHLEGLPRLVLTGVKYVLMDLSAVVERTEASPVRQKGRKGRREKEMDYERNEVRANSYTI